MPPALATQHGARTCDNSIIDPSKILMKIEKQVA